MITNEKWDELRRRMERLGIAEGDLIEKFIIGSGRGGQNLQKTSSCVYIKHVPTSIEVKCQKSRSRDMNRYFARQSLCERIETDILKIKTAKVHAVEKLRRQKKKRTKRAQEKVLENKRQRSTLKGLRQQPENP